MDKNDSSAGGGNYRSFTTREDDTDFSRWTLLRQADKNAAFTARKKEARPKSSGGVTFSTPQKKADDIFAPGNFRRALAPQGEDRFSPSYRSVEKVSIADMLKGARRDGGKPPFSRPQPDPARRESAASAMQQLPQATPFAPQAGNVSSTDPGYKVDSNGQVVFSTRRPAVPSVIKAATPGTERAAGILSARAFDYAASGSRQDALPQGGATISDMLATSQKGSGISISMPQRQYAPSMSAADRRAEAERMRGEANSALKRASTLEQLRSEAAYFEDLGRSGVQVPPQSQSAPRPRVDKSGHLVFSRSGGSTPTSIAAPASPRLRSLESSPEAQTVQAQYQRPSEEPRAGARPEAVPRAAPRVQAEPGRWNTSPRDPLAQASARGPERFARLFEGSSRMRSPSRRRESLKEIYRRIESCQ